MAVVYSIKIPIIDKTTPYTLNPIPSPMSYDIHDFVRAALERNQSRESIKKALLKAQWQADEIDAALRMYADVDFPIPVPRRKPYLSAREAFMYLVLFFCLYITAFSFGTLLFQFINRWIVDPLRSYSGSLEAIRMAVASLIIAFPIFLWLSYRMRRSIAKQPEKKSSKVRKWLTYITLFIAAAVIIGDLISLLFNLLSGELTIRFALKVLAVLLIAGSIFGYYLWDFRREERETV